MIITIANNKGGVGKTTLTLLLAEYLRCRRRKLLLVDLDDQRHLSLAVAGEHDIPPAAQAARLFRGRSVTPASFAGGDLIAAGDDLIGVAPAAGRKFVAGIDALARGYDAVLIDAPPGADVRLIAALTAARRVVVPIMPAVFSLMAARRIWAMMKELKAENKLAGFVVNMAQGNSPRDTAAIKELNAVFGRDVLGVLPMRAHIRARVEEGRPVLSQLRSGDARRTAAAVEKACRAIWRACRH